MCFLRVSWNGRFVALVGCHVKEVMRVVTTTILQLVLLLCRWWWWSLLICCCCWWWWLWPCDDDDDDDDNDAAAVAAAAADDDYESDNVDVVAADDHDPYCTNSCSICVVLFRLFSYIFIHVFASSKILCHRSNMSISGSSSSSSSKVLVDTYDLSHLSQYQPHVCHPVFAKPRPAVARTNLSTRQLYPKFPSCQSRFKSPPCILGVG